MSYIPRQEIEHRIVEAAMAASPRIQIIEAPRGAGKSALLRQVASRLAGRGRLPALIDMEKICTSPADFARYFPAAVIAAGAARAARPATAGRSADVLSTRRARDAARRIADESGRRRPDPAVLLDEALGFAAASQVEDDPPLVLLLDEFAEVARLARHAGLREALSIVARRLAEASPMAIVAAVSPASRPAALIEQLQRESANEMVVLNLAPMSETEMNAFVRSTGCPVREQPDEIDLWMRATGGRPLYAEILARRVGSGEDLATALARAMTPPDGGLHQECRFDYHLLVERSRGHSVVRTILALLASQEGMQLTGIARHLRIQLPTALDYLSWLLEVGLIRRDGPGYVFADPVLRLWVRLNGPEPSDLLEEVVRFLDTPRCEPLPPARPRGRRPRAVAPGDLTEATEPKPGFPRRHDRLMEID